MGDEHPLLQEGESAEYSAGDAQHWIGVYTEMINFCRQALAGGVAGDALRIQRRLVHLQKRLAFWARPGITKD